MRARNYIRGNAVDELVAAAALDRIAQLRARAKYWHRQSAAPGAGLAETLERHRADLLGAARDYYVEYAVGRPQTSRRASGSPRRTRVRLAIADGCASDVRRA